MSKLYSHIEKSICFDHVHAIVTRASASLDAAQKKPLVIFDIDDVLIVAKDQVLRGPRKDFWLDTYFFNDQHSEQEAFDISGYTWSMYQTEVTDSKVVDLHTSLKKHNIPTLALTAGWNGPLGHSATHCDDRVRMLKDAGIEFNGTFTNIPHTSFMHLENCGRNPSFKKGVLFACMIKKSTVLDAFLALAQYDPSHIVFVDDLMSNLLDMQDYCASKGIPYDGVHYCGIEAKDALHHSFDENIAHMQFQTALNEKIWLSDEEARRRLTHENRRSCSR